MQREASLPTFSGCALRRTVVGRECAGKVPERRRVATKEHKRQANGLIKQLEGRVHAGPPVVAAEITSAREFLDRSEFPPSSDYYNRLSRVQYRLETRTASATQPVGKRNYGGEAAGYWMQIQSAYDHVILSTCYGGEHNSQRGRIKVSHRFNQAGRIDFVELKFLRSLQPLLNGAFRKLVSVCDYQHLKKDWSSAEAFVLPVLPRELIFLFADIFRCERSEVLAWLINIGHNLTGDMLAHLGEHPPRRNPESGEFRSQLELDEVRNDPVAFPILQMAAGLEVAVDLKEEKVVMVRYCRRGVG